VKRGWKERLNVEIWNLNCQITFPFFLQRVTCQTHWFTLSQVTTLLSLVDGLELNGLEIMQHDSVFWRIPTQAFSSLVRSCQAVVAICKPKSHDSLFFITSWTSPWASRTILKLNTLHSMRTPQSLGIILGTDLDDQRHPSMTQKVAGLQCVSSPPSTPHFFHPGRRPLQCWVKSLPSFIFPVSESNPWSSIIYSILAKRRPATEDRGSHGSCIRHTYLSLNGPNTILIGIDLLILVAFSF